MSTPTISSPTAPTDTVPGRPSPRDDFFRYVNWEWFQENPIPDSEAEWGAFHILRDRTLQRLRDICEEVQAADAAPGTTVQIVRDYYRSGLDLEGREAAGIAPLQGLLTAIAAIETRADVTRAIASLHLAGLDPFFAIWVWEDFKRPGWNALLLRQGGLGMPERNYYLAADKSEIREQYRTFLTRLLALTGRSTAEVEGAVQATLRIETALADASAPMEEVRQVDKNYHPYRLPRARAQFSAIDWDAYFEELGVPRLRRMVVMQPAFLRRVNALIEETPLAELKAYLTLALLRGYADTLGHEFVEAHFDFYGRAVQGLREPQPVWKDVLSRQSWGILSNAFGPLYAERYFSATDKERVVRIVGYITDAFAARVRSLPWMSERTKRLTLEKLEVITFKMGYPDTWVDLHELEIGKTYATNVLNVARFDTRYRVRKAERRCDRSEWLMPPTVVNAMADYRREMTFPMAILQPPFFDSAADEAYNFGGIGAVIGHELTHFFDDQGSKFDVSGAMKSWWGKEDEHAFREKAEGFVTYYGRYAVDGVKVNPRLTLGENIADVGGLSIAFDAFRRYLQDEGSPSPADGLTPEQKLFTSWAVIWATQTRHEELERRALIDPHAPGEVRAKGTLSAIPQFYDAFGVQAGDGMYVEPESRPVLW